MIYSVDLQSVAIWNENTSESNPACFLGVYFLNPLKNDENA